MKARGHSGELRIAGRTAAKLGSWAFDRSPKSVKVCVHAEVREVDSFLISRKPLELKLDALTSQRAVESIALENGSADIVILW